MKRFMSKVNYRWSLITGRFRFFIVKEEKDLTACVEILEAVRRRELNRVTGNCVIESSAFAGKKINKTLVGCKDSRTGKVIGCMCITEAYDLKDIAKCKEEYHLSAFSDELLQRLVIFTRLAVLKSYRKSPAALILMSQGFKKILREGKEAVLMSCEPNLFSTYKTLGLRQIGPSHSSPSGGFRIPMIYMPDREYMKSINSPVLKLIKNIDFSKKEMISQWYDQLMQQQEMAQKGFVTYRSTDKNCQIDHVVTKGLSESGRKDFLRNAIIIKCKEDDVIIAENDGGKAFGIVKKGIVKVDIDGKTVANLKEGDIFGEIAFVLESKRTATLKAGDSNTQVLLCSISAVNRLKNDSDKLIVWQNLAKILANRLVQRTSQKEKPSNLQVETRGFEDVVIEDNRFQKSVALG